MKNTYVITGATGNTGGAVARELLKAGHVVKVLGRNVEKLKPLTDAGAIALQGDVLDENFLKTAFTGADGIYLMVSVPLNEKDMRMAYQKQSSVFLNAVKASGVKNIVWLSSVGTHDGSSKSIIQGLADMEHEWSKEKELNTLFLRASYFMENAMWQIDTIKQMGIAGGPIHGELKFPMVATKDIGKVAAEHLVQLDFKGQAHEYVLGQRDVSYNELTELIGQEIGKPDLKYVAFPYDDSVKAMIGMGMSEDASNRMVQLSRDINDGKVYEESKRTALNTTATSVEEFVKTIGQIYRSN
ncbi:NmrA/HSCARG family protein [soil metagenome]